MLRIWVSVGLMMTMIMTTGNKASVDWRGNQSVGVAVNSVSCYA